MDEVAHVLSRAELLLAQTHVRHVALVEVNHTVGGPGTCVQNSKTSFGNLELLLQEIIELDVELCHVGVEALLLRSGGAQVHPHVLQRNFQPTTVQP